MIIENKNIGTIGYSITAELSEEVKAALVEQGMLRILQGPVASEYETKALALVFPLAGDKDGKYSRKSLEAAIAAGTYPAFTDEEGKTRKFSRGDLPYSPELAAIWQQCCKGAEVEIAQDAKGDAIKADLGITDVTVLRYEGAVAAAPKYAAERKFVKDYLSANGGKLKDGSDRTVSTFADNPARNVPQPAVGPADEDGLAPWETDVTFLLAVREHMKALAAGE
jgi:hypothetical protein